MKNARRLCEAAGITVHTELSHDDGPRGDGKGHSDSSCAHPLLAQVLREATTNLLRHAKATTVTIVATPVSLSITNDGATGTGRPLRGILRLRERLEQVGGQLAVRRTGGEFTLAVCMRTDREAPFNSPFEPPTEAPAKPHPHARQPETLP